MLSGHIAPEQGHAFAVELKRRLIGDYEGADMTRQDAEQAIAHADDFVRAIRAWIAG